MLPEHKAPPPRCAPGDGAVGCEGSLDAPTLAPARSSRQQRRTLARVPLGADELVLSLDDRQRLDVRIWTPTGGVRMASANGITIKLEHVPALIAALEDARREALS